MADLSPVCATAAEVAAGLSTATSSCSDGDGELPPVGTEATADVEEDRLFVPERIEHAVRHKDRLLGRPSKFSADRTNGPEDPISSVFAEMTPTEHNDDPLELSARRVRRPFATAKLGIPEPSLGSEQISSGQDRTSQSVHYLHIPRHSLPDFRVFACNARNEALVDTNPYVLALKSHRAKLHAPLLDTPRTCPTLMQQLASDPQSLSHLDAAWDRELPFSADVSRDDSLSHFGTGFLSAPFASCYGAGCRVRFVCEEYDCSEERQLSEPRFRHTGEAQQYRVAGGLEQRSPLESATSVPAEPLDPLSPGSRSASSTACSSPSVCDEADIRECPGPRRSLERTGTVRASGPTLLHSQRAFALALASAKA